MSAVGFLGSSRQNRVLPVLTAFGLAGAHHPEKAFGSPKNVQHNMELCCTNWQGGGGGAFHFGLMGGGPGKWLEKFQLVCRNGLGNGLHFERLDGAI